jgi:hypothetical protein
LDPCKFLNINGLHSKKSQKIEKTQNKMVLLRRRPPVFLPKRVILGSFLTVLLFLHLQVIDHDALARIKNCDFSQKRRRDAARFSRRGAEIAEKITRRKVPLCGLCASARVQSYKASVAASRAASLR